MGKPIVTLDCGHRRRIDARAIDRGDVYCRFHGFTTVKSVKWEEEHGFCLDCTWGTWGPYGVVSNKCGAHAEARPGHRPIHRPDTHTRDGRGTFRDTSAYAALKSDAQSVEPATLLGVEADAPPPF